MMELNPEELKIKIVDENIRNRNERYPGLFNVVFTLDKSPDEEWVELFNSPTSYVLSIHPPTVNARCKEIVWQASEENIENDKHWVYDYVDSANKRFLPVLQKRIEQEENDRQREKAEAEKIAELNKQLKGDLHSDL